MTRRIVYRVPEDSEPKLCPRCGVVRTFGEFVVDRSKPSGRGWSCRVCDRERSTAYYVANREAVLARAAARRARTRPPAPTVCSECPNPLEGRQRLVCSPRCQERRFRRTNPEGYAKREAAKVERRRERRRQGLSS